jgi:hypothetical protein
MNQTKGNEPMSANELRIIKSTEIIPVDHPVFLLYGQPGICKTSLGYSAKDPLILDFDNGAHRAANRRDTLVINSWSDASALPEHATALAPYSTIVVDTVGRALDAILAHIALTEPKKAPAGNPTQQGWGTLKNYFRNWMNALRGLGKDVILIAHDKEDKDNDIRIVRPDILGGSYAEVFKIADFVGYVSMVGKQRILDFSPTDKWIGKNPAQWQPFAVPPVEKARTFLAQLVDQGREALGKTSQASASTAQIVQDWTLAIAGYTMAEEFSRAVPQIKSLNATLYPQVAKLLMDRASALGFTYDKYHKLFEKAQEAMVTL